jgi:hypothetical protein
MLGDNTVDHVAARKYSLNNVLTCKFTKLNASVTIKWYLRCHVTVTSLPLPHSQEVKNGNLPRHLSIIVVGKSCTPQLAIRIFLSGHLVGGPATQ